MKYFNPTVYQLIVIVAEINCWMNYKGYNMQYQDNNFILIDLVDSRVMSSEFVIYTLPTHLIVFLIIFPSTATSNGIMSL